MQIVFIDRGVLKGLTFEQVEVRLLIEEEEIQKTKRRNDDDRQQNDQQQAQYKAKETPGRGNPLGHL